MPDHVGEKLFQRQIQIESDFLVQPAFAAEPGSLGGQAFQFGNRAVQLKLGFNPDRLILS
jgi:hypothetical protein